MQADSGSCARSSVIGCDERRQNLLSAGVTKGAASSASAGLFCLCFHLQTFHVIHLSLELSTIFKPVIVILQQTPASFEKSDVFV